MTHRIEVGVRGHFDAIERLHTRGEYGIVGGRMVRTSDTLLTETENEANTLALAMHALDSVTWKFLTVSGGARIESLRGEAEDALTGESVRLTQQVVLPGGGLFVALPEDLGLFAGVHRGFSPIPPPASPTTSAEESVAYEWGARWSPKGLRVEAIGFFSDYTNLANVCTASSGCDPTDLDRQFDGGTALVGGLEGYLQSEMPLTETLRLPARVAYTYTQAEFTSDFSSADPIFGEVTAGDEVPYIPPHQVSASAGLETDQWGLYLSGTFVASMREVAGSGTPGPFEANDANFVLDAAGHVEVASGLTTYVTVQNMLDATYVASHRPFGARPGAPIWIQAGAKLQL
jgi:Fe(3+) dicitrate transport protein